MNKQNSFDATIRLRVIHKLEVRAILFAILSTTIAVGLLFSDNPPFVAELGFFVFSLIAFLILGIAMVYEQRHLTGKFGTTLGDAELILAWTQEEKYWWGKTLF